MQDAQALNTGMNPQVSGNPYECGKMPMTTDIIKRDTVAQLVENYEVALTDVTQAYTLLHAAKDRLNTSFGMGQRIYSFDVLPHGY